MRSLALATAAALAALAPTQDHLAPWNRKPIEQIPEEIRETYATAAGIDRDDIDRPIWITWVNGFMGVAVTPDWKPCHPREAVAKEVGEGYFRAVVVAGVHVEGKQSNHFFEAILYRPNWFRPGIDGPTRMVLNWAICQGPSVNETLLGDGELEQIRDEMNKQR